MDRERMNVLLGMTEEEQDARAAEYDNDAWDASHLGKPVMGRPRLADEETRAVTVRLPVSQIARLDKAAKDDGKTRSSAIRAALDSWLDKAAMF